MTAARPSTRGFTLIELSIVLVIIGLVVGGILTGRDLIDASKVNATIAQYQSFQTAATTFYDKYDDELPGDITQATAVKFSLQPTSRPGSGDVFHGNGVFDAQNNNCNYSNHLGWENVLFWRDLSSAGLIVGNFSTAVDGPVANVAFDDLDPYVPASKLGRSVRWFVFGVCGQNYYYLGGNIASTRADGFFNWSTQQSVRSSYAYAIDKKLDDAVPNTGTVQASALNGYTLINGYGTSGDTCVTPAASSPTGRAAYNLSAASRCNLVLNF